MDCCLKGNDIQSAHVKDCFIQLTLINRELVNGITLVKCEKIEDCKTGIEDKMVHSPFPNSVTRSEQKFDLIHRLCGPKQTMSPDGKRYILQPLFQNKIQSNDYISIYLGKPK